MDKPPKEKQGRYQDNRYGIFLFLPHTGLHLEYVKLKYLYYILLNYFTQKINYFTLLNVIYLQVMHIFVMLFFRHAHSQTRPYTTRKNSRFYTV